MYIQCCSLLLNILLYFGWWVHTYHVSIRKQSRRGIIHTWYSSINRRHPIPLSYFTLRNSRWTRAYYSTSLTTTNNVTYNLVYEVLRIHLYVRTTRRYVLIVFCFVFSKFTVPTRNKVGTGIIPSSLINIVMLASAHDHFAWVVYAQRKINESCLSCTD